MSLIRSEHVNDQAVREAKEAIKQAENSLEEARSQLEKRERAQYHEEQIWSDTIRRNSTWVTFGLMGLNIFLLLATMIVIEPWRRRRMVREIKNTLEAQQAIYQPAAVVPSLPAVPLAESTTAATSTTPVEIEKKPEPVEITPTSPVVAEAAEEEFTAQPDTAVISGPGSMSSILEATTEPVEDRPYTAPISGEQPVAVTIETLEAEIQDKPRTTFETWQEKAKYIAQDIISERTISMRRVDYTAAILQGAAAGAVITAAIVAMIIGR
jgi:sensitive to high expression protein 9